MDEEHLCKDVGHKITNNNSTTKSNKFYCEVWKTENTTVCRTYVCIVCIVKLLSLLFSFRVFFTFYKKTNNYKIAV